jgi:chromosome segregation ATPase
MQMLMQTCADASSAVQSTRQLSAALLAENYSARETACVDANTSREPRAVCHIAVGTDSARHAQSVHVQTQEMGNERSQAERSQAFVQTVPEIRVTQYHVDSQTDPVACSKSVHAIMQTEGVVLTTRAHSDAAARRLLDLESELAEHAAQKRGLEDELQIARGKQQSQEQQIFVLESGLESLRAVTHQQACTHQAHRDQAKKELAVLQHELADHAMRRQILEEELQVAAQTRQMQENQIRFLTREIETMGAAVKQQVSTKSPARIHVASAKSPRASPRSHMLEDAL